MWEATLDGRRLTFHLAGINNQNLLMRDAETGSWWQQTSGESILGPLKGRSLTEVPHDELTWETWRAERPAGRVLLPDADALAAGRYAPARWEERMASAPAATAAAEGEPLPPRALVLGVTVGASSVAYPFTALREQHVILDDVGGAPIAVVMDLDSRSVRVFDRRMDDCALELLAVPDAWPLRLVDAQTGSTWDFTGKAVGGEYHGAALRRIEVLPADWFDWKAYHPGTTVY